MSTAAGPGAADAAELEYVGFWARAWAAVIDTVALLVLLYPVLLSIYGLAYLQSTALIKGPADFLLSWVLPAVAWVVLWVKFQGTPGKWAIGARIVDARSGGPASTAQYVVRYLGYYLSLLPLGLGFIWIGLDPRRQGWHDKLAGTVVVRARKRGPEAVKFQPPGD